MHGTHRTRRALPLAGGILLVVLLLALPSASGATTVANFSRSAYGYTSTLTPAQEANRYQVLVVQTSDAAMVPILKAANPNLKVLMYEGIMAAQNSNPAIVTCTSGPWVLANHPSWILKDQSGNPILYQNHYLLDVANTGYQQTCLANVIALVRQGGFDGVYWDMANARLSWTLPPGSTVPQYPTDPSWQTAVYSMLSYAGTQLHAAGMMNVANIGGAFLFPGLWQQWNGPLDGAEEESFTDDHRGLAVGAWAWPKQLPNIVWSEANHKLVLLHSWNTTHAGNVYGLASMMLVAGGESSYSTSNGCYSTCEVWYPEYTTAQQLGAPVGPFAHQSGGAYVRRFQNGIVVVNASTANIGTVGLGGGTYSGSGIANAGSVGLPATTGYILLEDAPVITAAPAVIGNAVIGATLTTSVAGSWSPTSTTSYQWERCANAAANSCSAIPGATGSSYTVADADADGYLSVAATVSNSAGSTTASSGVTAQVPKPLQPRITRHPVPSTQPGPTAVVSPTKQGFSLVARLYPKRFQVAVACPHRVQGQCRFALTMSPTTALVPDGKTRAGTHNLASGKIVLSAGKRGTIKIRLTAAARRLLAHGRSLRVRIRLRIRYDGQMATLVFFARVKAPSQPRHG